MKASEEEFFKNQEEEIMRAIHLEALRVNDDLQVPPGYFAEMEEKVIGSTRAPRGRVITFRRFIWLAAGAAAAVVAGVFFYLQNAAPDESAFLAMLEQEPVTVEDLPYFATELEYEEMLLHAVATLPEGELWLITADSLAVTPAVSAAEPNEPTETPTPDIKPADQEDAPTWEELSEEEIMEYLLDEGEINW
jgi:hypothetical protein